jgi:hypothetical protein
MVAVRIVEDTRQEQPVHFAVNLRVEVRGLRCEQAFDTFAKIEFDRRRRRGLGQEVRHDLRGNRRGGRRASRDHLLGVPRP